MAKFIYQWRNTEHGRRLFRRPTTGTTATPVATTTSAAPVVTFDADDEYEDETETAAAAEAAPKRAREDYAPRLKTDLIEMAEERGLDSSGTKADIIARLEDDDDAA